MEYINKNNAATANSIIDRYLQVAKTEPWYGATMLYRQFGSFSDKNKLVDEILLPEQKNRCCYCQIGLPSHTYATIEHIIRQSIPDAASMVRYFRPQYLELNRNNICHTNDYIDGRSQPGQYPHKVAYHNFAMACPTCNNARGDKDIDPLFLSPAINQEVDYNRQTGELTWLTDPEAIKAVPTAPPTVEKVNLNNSLLKAIRSVWFYGKDHPTDEYSTPDTIETETQKQELVYQAFGDALSSDPDITMEDLNAFLSLLTSHLWDITLRYAYFKTL